MASAKLFSALFVDAITISRRGYASVSQSIASRGGASARSGVKKAVEETSEKVSWVPDPVTGYYRPEKCAGEVDVAELRNMLLKNKTNKN